MSKRAPPEATRPFHMLSWPALHGLRGLLPQQDPGPLAPSTTTTITITTSLTTTPRHRTRNQSPAPRCRRHRYYSCAPYHHRQAPPHHHRDFHQPIGFVCCHCRYRSSGSFCSNPARVDCPHRCVPRCRRCPILFTPPRSGRLARGGGGGGG
ncbi:hypothetical protein F4780DRAFT_781890 [Xylariomycetidae sp. FL0641]|nr:hypothetical protein F4780DRAFT_781890 [Xylariomycetidae sp. FL0641]